MLIFALLAATSPVDSFHQLRDKILDQLLADEPQGARLLGLHDYDSKLQKFDTASLTAQAQHLHDAQKKLAAVKDKGFSPDDTLDLQLLRYEITNRLFAREELDAAHRRPSFYESLFGVDSYINLEYAPLEERAKRLLAHEEAALKETSNVTKNLKLPLPKPIAETAVKIYQGYADYLRGDVMKLIAPVGDAAFQKRFKETNENLAKEAEKISSWLKEKAVPTGDNSYALGKERYEKLIEAQEGVRVPLDAFKKMAELNLRANQQAYDQFAAKTKWTFPKPADLLNAATKLVAESRQFVVDHHIVTLASQDTAEVRESPPYMRWNSAFLNPSGPFDSVHRAFYYISPPDPSWSKEQQAEYLPSNGVLLSTTIHEVYPGHFVQGRWLEKAPTRTQKIVSAYSYVEGWAHYIEQMMIEEGFHQSDAEGHLGQLSDALLRNCRFLASIGLHTEGMSVEQAEKLFHDQCHQDPVTAHEQAVRGTFDPGYFAYTFGKLEILALRAEAKEKLGAKFSLQAFHDALLAHGQPPIPFIHDRVLSELTRQ